MIWALCASALVVYLAVGLAMVPKLARAEAKRSLDTLAMRPEPYVDHRRERARKHESIAWWSTWGGLIFWPISGARLLADRAIEKVVEDHLALERAREILSEEKDRAVELKRAEAERFDAEMAAAERQARLDRQERELKLRELSEANRSRELETRAKERELRAGELEARQAELEESRKRIAENKARHEELKKAASPAKPATRKPARKTA